MKNSLVWTWFWFELLISERLLAPDCSSTATCSGVPKVVHVVASSFIAPLTSKISTLQFLCHFVLRHAKSFRTSLATKCHVSAMYCSVSLSASDKTRVRF